MDDFITMRDKILQSNIICTSSNLGMVLDDRLILQAGGQGTFSSRSLAGQVDLLCMGSRGASGWVLGRLVEGQ